eukprot:NODE_277_length_11973_cov_0.221895.p6 type:complete len:175 gc:universal NODE_277_length_11973_cov_0.221895:8373-8897(+)
MGSTSHSLYESINRTLGDRFFEFNHLKFGGIEVYENGVVKRCYNNKKMVYPDGQRSCFIKSNGNDINSNFLIYDPFKAIIGILQKLDSVWIACLKTLTQNDLIIRIVHEKKNCYFYKDNKVIGKYKRSNLLRCLGKPRRTLHVQKFTDPYILIFLKLLIDEITTESGVAPKKSK